MALTNNKAWYDKAFIAVAPKGGTAVQLRSKTTTMSISGGGFDIEGLETFGGKIKRENTKDDIEISFDGIPTDVQTFDWIFHGTTSTATTANSQTSVDYRITILWTDEVGITSAGQAIATASEAYRQSYVDASCTSLDYNMDAGEHLTATMTFKLPFEDETGSVNFLKEMSPTTSALAAFSPYTSTVKFR